LEPFARIKAAVMPRVVIDLPERFAFSTEIAIYQSHINAAGHLDNAQLLTLVSEARKRFFAALGYGGELDVEGLGIVIADAAVQYRSEAFHGEILVFEMAAADFNKYGCDLVWRARSRDAGREVARGKTGIVFFDYGTRKVAHLPAAFAERAGAGQPG
jgi:4-hydroxybenzoyl-CoA thioesterase